MSLVFNMVGGGGCGGKLKDTDAIISVLVQHGATASAAKGGVTIQPTIWTQASPNIFDYALFVIKSSLFDAVNPWTISATYGGNTKTANIVVSTNEQYELNLADTIGNLKIDIQASGWALLSNAIGDKFSSNGRYFQRTTDEPIIACIYIDSSNYWGYGAISKSATLAGTYNSYGDMVKIGPITSPSGSVYYAYHMSGVWPSAYQPVFQVDGVNYQFSYTKANPYIDENGAIACTDSSKQNEMYTFISRLVSLS